MSCLQKDQQGLYIVSELSGGVGDRENRGDSAEEATRHFKKLFAEVLPLRLSMKLSSHEIRGNGLPCGQT